MGNYKIDKVLTFAETLWNLLWFVSLICFLYLFPSPLLIAILTNYLCKMISEQINLLQTVSKVISFFFYPVEAVRANAFGGKKRDEKMLSVLCLSFVVFNH